MRVSLLAVGTRMPAWVNAGVAEYSKRLRPQLGFSLVEVPLARRGKSGDVARCLDKEGSAMLARIRPDDHVIALEVAGTPLSTRQLATRLERFQHQGSDLVLLVGGPDGLAESCRERAQESWSLSALTLPHGLVRVLVAEQLYRALSVLSGHPYHRE